MMNHFIEGNKRYYNFIAPLIHTQKNNAFLLVTLGPQLELAVVP